MTNLLNWWFTPTVGKGVLITAIVFVLAWETAGWILDEPLAWKIPLAILLVVVEIILLLALRIAIERLVEYAGEIEDERSE